MAPRTAIGRAEKLSAQRAQRAASAPQLRLASDEIPQASPGAAAADDGMASPSRHPVVIWGRVKVADIDIPPDRLRKVDTAWAEVLGVSMRDDGQQQPVRLILEETGRCTLQLGAHRVVGARLAQLEMLDAGWVSRADVGAEQARIPEIIENLIRNDLDALSRAHFLAEYKAIHEVLHPESRHGGDRRSAKARARGDQVAMFAFRSEAAEKTGLSERAIQLAVAIWTGLAPASRDRLDGTPLARNQAALKALATLDATLQGKVLDLMLAEPAGAASIGDAILLAQGKRLPSTADRLFRSVSSNLGRLPAKSRATLWEAYEDEILAAFRKKGIVQ